MTRLSALLFAVLSLLFMVLIIWFVSLGSPVGDWNAKIDSLVANWNQFNSLSTIWRLEFLVVNGIAWAAFNLADLNKWWNLIGIGHILMLTEYIFMIGGYKEVKTEESFHILNEIANWVFISSNMIWVIGMMGVYAAEKGFLKIAGMILSGISIIFITIIFFEWVEQQQLMGIAMPVILLLYLLNTYYGYYLYKSKIKSTN